MLVQNRPLESRPPRLWSASVTCVALVLMCLVAALSFAPQAAAEGESAAAKSDAKLPVADAAPPSTTTPFTAKLPCGVAVELLGVSEHPSNEKSWWRPDGSPLAEPPCDPLKGSVDGGQGYVTREFAVQLHNLPSEPVGTEMFFDPMYNGAADGYPKRLGKKEAGLQATTVSLPDKPTVTVRVRVAAGPWRTVQESENGDEATDSMGRGVAFSHVHEKDGDVFVAVAHNVKDLETRVIAIGKDGKEHLATSQSNNGAAGFTLLSPVFSKLSLADIRAFRLESRPYQWVEFRNVSLRPGQKTDVQISQNLTGGGEASGVRRSTGEPEGGNVPQQVSSLGKKTAFTIGPGKFAPGDKIVIEEVWTERGTLTKGDRLRVKGTYTLSSRPAATMSLSITTDAGKARGGGAPVAREIRSGTASFEMERTITADGHLHIVLYDMETGESFGTVYFGTDAQMKEIAHWKNSWLRDDSASAPSATGSVSVVGPKHDETSATSPPGTGKAGATGPKISTDQVIVEDLALEMLVAIRKEQDDKLQSMAVDRPKEWREALPHFALEMRERFTQNTGKTFVMYPSESLVEGDRAVVRCTRPKDIPGEVTLVLYFVKTPDGWRNWMLRAAPPKRPLAEFLKEKPPVSSPDASKQPAAAAKPKPSAAKKTEFVIGPRRFSSGDTIAIKEVWSTNGTFANGDTVTVKGTYTLYSRPAATLLLSVTTSGEDDGHDNCFRTQRVKAGNAVPFEMELPITVRGHLHVSFYDIETGNGIGGVYFGTDAQMKEIAGWKDGWMSQDRKVDDEARSAKPESTTDDTPSASERKSKKKEFVLGPQKFTSGDKIEIKEVWSTHGTLAKGDTVTVKGTCTLYSRPMATMLLGVTIDPSKGPQGGSTLERQVESGNSVPFEMTLPVTVHGHLHVSLYDVKTHKSIGTVYFGTYDQMREIADWDLSKW